MAPMPVLVASEIALLKLIWLPMRRASAVYSQLSSASNYTAAAALIGTTGALANAETNLGQAMNQLAADSRRITNQIGFNNAIADATNTGLGAIVDADLAKESARLQSLQVKQQLSSQALSIANQSPQSLLGLFR